MSVDIVNLIENNPITKLNGDYQSNLVEKIKNAFNNYEQQMFLSSFFCYLKYDLKEDFVIDLDNIWKWLGFSNKAHAKTVLIKNFSVNKDYIFLLTKKGEQKKDSRGGHNKEIIMMNVDTFKKFCLKSCTKKADEIHDYFIKLENILFEITKEESERLKEQLQQKEKTILDKEKEKQTALEKVIIDQFPVNTECVYIGIIDNTNQIGENLIKFGHTNDLSTRVTNHKKIYNNFILINAFKVQNKVEIENLIKIHPKIKKQIRCIEVDGKNKTEIISYDKENFTIEKLTKYIKDIIQSKTYSIDNFNKLLKHNNELEDEIRLLKEKLEVLQNENHIKYVEINELKEKLGNQQKILETINNENQSVYKNVLLPDDDVNIKFNEFVNSICIVRPDVEEISVNIEGRFRLWNNVKPTKEMFHSLKSYLDTRFKPKRINGQHGYIGIKLKSVEYKKSYSNVDVETFIFHACKFSDTGKILNSTLLKEYQEWKISIDKELTENDMKEIKDYLNSSPYALKATVWTSEGSNEGYYGISLKKTENKHKIISSTGKKVFKRQVNTDELLGTWDTIVKAAEYEGISPTKMSRSIKNKTIFSSDYYYCEK